MTSPSDERSSPSVVERDPGMRTIVLWIPAAAVLAHLAAAALTPYGIFRDELYYIACSKRPAFGYVDHPPLSIWLLGAGRWLLGESLFAIRIIPSLLSGVTIWLTGLIVLRMGGGRYAVILAGVGAALSPIALGMHSVYSMNALDHCFWTLGAYLLLLLRERPAPGRWLLLGLVIGLGSLNKIGMLWFAAGAMTAVLLTGDLRRQLRRPWPWIAAAAAILLFLPFVLWNLAHDFAHLEFIRNATAWKYGGVTRMQFVHEQFLLQNPLAAPLWIGGLFFLLRREAGRLRPLLMIWLVPFVILLVNGHSKGEYLAPAYYTLYAAGAVWFERLTARRSRVFRIPAVTLLALSGLLLAPMAVPVLPVPAFKAYNAALMPQPRSNEGHELQGLPQFFADMHGWERLAKTISDVYRTLPEHEKADAVVFVRNYGEAGALEYFADRYPVPRVISVHNNYWIWGYPDRIGTVIVLGGDAESHRASCDTVIAAGVFRCDHCMPYENNQVIWICRGLRRPVAEIWRDEKHFI